MHSIVKYMYYPLTMLTEKIWTNKFRISPAFWYSINMFLQHFTTFFSWNLILKISSKIFLLAYFIRYRVELAINWICLNQYKFLWNFPSEWHYNPFKNKSCLNSNNNTGIWKKELIDILLAHECRFTLCHGWS